MASWEENHHTHRARWVKAFTSTLSPHWDATLRSTTTTTTTTTTMLLSSGNCSIFTCYDENWTTQSGRRTCGKTSKRRLSAYACLILLIDFLSRKPDAQEGKLLPRKKTLQKNSQLGLTRWDDFSVWSHISSFHPLCLFSMMCSFVLVSCEGPLHTHNPSTLTP